MRELLSLKNLRLQGPLTFADTSTAPFSGMPNHWDIGVHLHGGEGSRPLEREHGTN